MIDANLAPYLCRLGGGRIGCVTNIYSTGCLCTLSVVTDVPWMTHYGALDICFSTQTAPTCCAPSTTFACLSVCVQRENT